MKSKIIHELIASEGIMPLGRTSLAEEIVCGVMEDLQGYDFPNAIEHLDRAKAHLNEAWIAISGQNARTVQKLVDDIDRAHKFFDRVAQAKPGEKVQFGGKTFVVHDDSVKL